MQPAPRRWPVAGAPGGSSAPHAPALGSRVLATVVRSRGPGLAGADARADVQRRVPRVAGGGRGTRRRARPELTDRQRSHQRRAGATFSDHPAVTAQIFPRLSAATRKFAQARTVPAVAVRRGRRGTARSAATKQAAVAIASAIVGQSDESGAWSAVGPAREQTRPAQTRRGSLAAPSSSISEVWSGWNGHTTSSFFISRSALPGASTLSVLSK